MRRIALWERAFLFLTAKSLSSDQIQTETLPIYSFVRSEIGEVPASSVRSYLNLNTPGKFLRTSKGRYALATAINYFPITGGLPRKPRTFGKATLFEGDCKSWLSQREPQSIHAVITDPPYGLHEYTTKEQLKLRAGKGGVWRIPPAFDGHKRSPLPRFTVLTDDERSLLEVSFKNICSLVAPGPRSRSQCRHRQ